MLYRLYWIWGWRSLRKAYWELDFDCVLSLSSSPGINVSNEDGNSDLHSVQIYFWHFFENVHSANFKNRLNQIDWASHERRQKQEKVKKSQSFFLYWFLWFKLFKREALWICREKKNFGRFQISPLDNHKRALLHAVWAYRQHSVQQREMKWKTHRNESSLDEPFVPSETWSHSKANNLRASSVFEQQFLAF